MSHAHVIALLAFGFLAGALFALTAVILVVFVSALRRQQRPNERFTAKELSRYGS